MVWIICTINKRAIPKPMHWTEMYNTFNNVIRNPEELEKLFTLIF